MTLCRICARRSSCRPAQPLKAWTAGGDVPASCALRCLDLVRTMTEKGRHFGGCVVRTAVMFNQRRRQHCLERKARKTNSQCCIRLLN